LLISVPTSRRCDPRSSRNRLTVLPRVRLILRFFRALASLITISIATLLATLTFADEHGSERTNSLHFVPHSSMPHSVRLVEAEVQPAQFEHETAIQPPANPFLAPAQKKQTDPTGFVQLNLGATFELRALVEIVIDRLNLQITYDDELLKKKVNIRTPKRIPSSSLWPLLNSILRAEGLVIQESELAGWRRIVSITNETGSRLPALVPLRPALVPQRTDGRQENGMCVRVIPKQLHLPSCLLSSTQMLRSRTKRSSRF